MNNKERWLCSLADSDNWNNSESFDTKVEAIEAGKRALIDADYDYMNDLFGIDVDDVAEVEYFFIGRTKTFEPSIDGIWTIESVQEDAYDFGGEFAESYLDVVKIEEIIELENNLTKIFNEWAEKYRHEPNFYQVEQIEKVAVLDEN